MVILLTAVSSLAASNDLAADAPSSSASAPGRVSFNAHIRPIFAKHCVGCHGGVKQASGLSLIYREQALAECESGLTPIVPGQPAESYLLDRVTDADPEMRMPPADHGPPLSAEEIALLTQWISEGAEYQQHWSFEPPEPQTPPGVNLASWPRAPLDQFVLAKLEAADLRPAAEADKATWLRRATLDLTGLPPTAAEYAEFELDNRPDAYERVVDRLLASPRYGERWAAMWLDLARYADTMGYEKDPHREIWPYRDWLIRALNDDMPYDEFTVKQLAGDLLPNATIDDRLATALHRNTQTNTEGGTDDEEFRMAAVLDRVRTTWQVWQASTFGCAQCHSHPYDPITHEEFYQFVAFFNSSRDDDLDPETPLLRAPEDPAAWNEAQRLDARIAEIRRELFAKQSALAADVAMWRPLRADVAQPTGPAKLMVRDAVDAGAMAGESEIIAEGTIAAGIAFTLEFPLGDAKTFSALRIEALPADLAAAAKVPEMGFALTRLKGFIVPPAGGGEPVEIALTRAFCDEPAPLLDPEDSLRDNNDGWGDFPRQSFPRTAVFYADKPTPIAAGSKLRLAMNFGRNDSGGGGLCIRRGRYAMSDRPEWSALAADATLVKLREELAALVDARNKMPSIAVPVMAEQAADFARKTHTFVRGNWLDREAEVRPGVPKVMPPLPAGVPADRLAMARWLASRTNPLTARVMVNRLWQELFGTGIVETAEDFGTSGQLPSHPELFDYLALRFQNEQAWSAKQALRELVLSATYRQAGGASAEKLELDPRNRLLSRGPRTRLTAEMIRDQALALSGRLSAKMYGKPVMPPQPDGVWRSVYNGAKWEPSEGEDRFRRAIYTYWKRTSGYPSMLTFDMPSRDVCTVRRVATNTPLQALVTLNDEAHMELAKGFAEQMAAAAKEPAVQIAAGYRLATGHAMAPAKLERCVELYEEAIAAFDKSPEESAKLAATREAYALTVVANAMLNFDEVLTK